ncbi:MAG: nucleoside recognition domain-containing protein [Clostridiales bacterium]|nr:nucleoside recognition domain-containing protein [Clostridiales bacterium]
MLNVIWAAMLVAGIITAIINGKVEEVGIVLVNSGNRAFSLCMTLAGMMALWCGLMKIAEKGGLTRIISRLAGKPISTLFPGIPKEHRAVSNIMMNLAANFLGLGNTATPLGIKAMESLNELNHGCDKASDEMCMFLVLNTSALQFIPSTLIALRAAAGSVDPGGITGMVWIASSVSLLAGILSCNIFSALYKTKKACI